VKRLAEQRPLEARPLHCRVGKTGKTGGCFAAAGQAVRRAARASKEAPT
jgi:hypothetical protein